MIIVAIIALSAVVIVALLAALNGLPAFPSSIMDIVNWAAAYLGSGFGLLYTFTNRSVVRTLFTITIATEGIIYGYKFVMWVAKKIPMFGVSD